MFCDCRCSVRGGGCECDVCFVTAGVVYEVAGVSVPNVVQLPLTSASEGGSATYYVMWDSEFLHEGYLYAIEGIAKTAGLITIEVG